MTEEKQKFEYVAKTDDEIKQLALDTLGQQIFWASMLPAGSKLLHSLFMPLTFMDDATLKSLEAIKAVPYEYFSTAFGSVNGYPSFMSVKFVSADDYARMFEKLKLMKAAVDAV